MESEGSGMSSYEDEVDMDLGNKTGLQFQTDKVNTLLDSSTDKLLTVA